MKTLIVATAWFLATMSAYGQTSKPTPRPTLKETLGWIQDSLNNHRDVEEETAEGTERHAVRLVDFSGCRVHFVLTESYAGNEMVHLDYYFDMGVMDATSSGFHHFDTSGPGEFIAPTKGSLEKISIPNGIIRQGSVFTAEFYSPYGDDFAKAFIHAVKLCGGKPSFFTNSDGQDSDRRASLAAGGAAAQSATPEEPIDLSAGMEPKETPQPSARPTRPRKDIPAIAKAANGAIVSIIMSDKDGRAIAKGTGFLVSKDGRIVTNYHVIAEGSSAKAKLPDGSLFAVDGVLAFDKVRDVALIKAHGENFRTLTLGNSDRLQVGEDVVAIGNPLSLESTVSNGIVSGIRTDEERGGKFLQVTTPISPGSSGGPLFNMMGEVVGITTMYLEGGENLNFAIPINDAKRLLLNQSAKLQNLPNEPEPVEAQTHHGDAPPSIPATKTNPSDSDYYHQLFDAGGFSEDHPSYVCFRDDLHSGRFFTFFAVAYDENYSKAQKKSVEILESGGDTTTANPEIEKVFEIEQALKRTAPYVTFLSEFLLSNYSLEQRKFLRDGGRVLIETDYEKGVKGGGMLYLWDGSKWVQRMQPQHPEADVQTSKIFYLSIEPSTMRYSQTGDITVTAGHGKTAVTRADKFDPWDGVCEKVPNPK